MTFPQLTLRKIHFVVLRHLYMGSQCQANYQWRIQGRAQPPPPAYFRPNGGPVTHIRNHRRRLTHSLELLRIIRAHLLTRFVSSWWTFFRRCCFFDELRPFVLNFGSNFSLALDSCKWIKQKTPLLENVGSQWNDDQLFPSCLKSLFQSEYKGEANGNK